MILTSSPIGENAVIFYLPKPLQDNYPLILNDLAEQLRLLGVVDCVTAYNSLLAIFDPQRHSVEVLTALLHNHLPEALINAGSSQSQRLIRVPVCYDGKFALDLERVATRAGLSTDEVIKRHTEKIHTVCCLGFIPGFAFMGYVDERISTPRLAEPRAVVPAGSVGIAGRQTGVYPADSPGGWNIVGRTPMVLYAPERDLYSIFKMGDAVQFYPISLDEFNTWGDSHE